jgi:glycine C-acetyltransferase
LGLATHPHVIESAQRAAKDFGAGLGGPPLLNGYTTLHRQLEERLAVFKHAEDALIFPTGYSANVGLLSGLVTKKDRVLYDQLSHASFFDGLRLGGLRGYHFPHNDVGRLQQLLTREKENGDVFVGCEGVYSMDGDVAPLDKIVPVCKNAKAILVVDDAHGTGVLGETGSGTAEYFGVQNDVGVTMGTFSKTFGVVGGFVCASKPIINYLRYFARSYMFSASLPPMVIGAVLAGLDVIEHEPERIRQLHENVKYAARKLRDFGVAEASESAILTLPVPTSMSIRKAAYHLHKRGLFVNSIEYPAVPQDQQRFRISIMATHTKLDIDRLVDGIASVWQENEALRLAA